MNKVPRFCGWLSPFEPRTRPFLTNQNPVNRNQLKTKKMDNYIGNGFSLGSRINRKQIPILFPSSFVRTYGKKNKGCIRSA